MSRPRALLLTLLPWAALVAACDRQDEPEPLRETTGPRQSVKLPPADFAGEYSSNWGPLQCAQTHTQVDCVYQRVNAKMSCEAIGSRLKCTWVERTARGRATFKRRPNGDLIGTTGYGESDDNRGAWMLTRKR